MKKHLVPFTALLVLTLAAPLALQSQEFGNLAVPGATYATGTVVSQRADALVIRTDTGETRTFLLDAATVGVKPYAVGSRVSVDFTLNGQNSSVAKQIMGVSAGTASVETTPAPVAATTTLPAAQLTPAPTPAPAAKPIVESTPSTYETPVAETTTTTATDDRDDELPATASPLPLIALLGAGSLGSGLALRLRRKRS